jgi:circadian clock protein KaiC
MERISTGNVALDRILSGGLPRNSINVIMGLPGSGKTVLAQTMTFANAGQERPVLYLTTLSEPLSKIITYLQELEFADVDFIGTQAIYESLAEELRTNVDQLPERLLKLIQQHRPHLVIIDSFKALADMVPDTRGWRRMVFELAGLLSAYDTTTLWVGEYSADMSAHLVEFAVADGIIELRREPSGSRDDRYLRVVKLRGSDFLDGNHAFTLTKRGLHIFPRLVSPAVLEQYTPVPERLQTGIGGLDALIDHGVLRGTSTLVAGPSGAGKSILGLHFLRHGVSEGEAGLLVAFQENPTQLRRTMTSLGWKPDRLLGAGRLDILYRSPVELHIDFIVEEIFERIEHYKVRRVVIDALGDLESSASDPRRFSDYIYSLVQWFAARNITAMLVLESPETSCNDLALLGRKVPNMSDNTVLLSMELDNDLRRSIRILKSRGSAHDGQPHTLRITPSGMEID